jgi:hypothetical protein
MDIVFFYALSIFSVLLCLVDWRKGVILALIMGFLQDPMRKLMPGEPVYMTLYSSALSGAVLMGALLAGVSANLRKIAAWKDFLRTPGMLFVLWVVIQSAVSVLKSGSLALGFIGMVAYLAPMPTIFLVYHYVRSEKEIYKYLTIYVVAVLTMVSGLYFSYLGFEWEVLQSVGAAMGRGLYIYPTSGGRLELLAGFFRSPEIAAWHAGAAICFILAILLFLDKRMAVKLPLNSTIRGIWAEVWGSSQTTCLMIRSSNNTGR